MSVDRKQVSRSIKKSESIAVYFETLMKSRPDKPNGLIDLPIKNLNTMIDCIETEKDFQDVNDAIYQYIGHRRTIPVKYVDKLLLKALEDLKQPELAYDILNYHAELLIHPSDFIMRTY